MEQKNNNMRTYMATLLIAVAALWILVPAFHVHTEDTAVTTSTTASSQGNSHCLICAFTATSFIDNACEPAVVVYPVVQMELITPPVHFTTITRIGYPKLRAPPHLFS